MTSATPELDLPPDHLLRQLIDAIAAHPEVREPLLRVLLTEDFLALPGRVSKLQNSFEDFREENRAGFTAVNQRIDETQADVRALREETRAEIATVNQRIDETQADVRALREEARTEFATVNQRIDENTRAIRSQAGSLGRLLGRVVKRVCPKSSLPGADRWPGMMLPF